MGYPRAAAPRALAVARVEVVYDAIAAATDDLDLQAELRRRCYIESWCNWYGDKGVHVDDSSLGKKRWGRAVARGLIDPEVCPEHALGETRAERNWWSTVGAFGNVSAYVIRHAGDCVHPRAMADPYLAAKLAVAHMEVLCKRYKACTCPARARWWAGPGIWDKRRPTDRLGRVTRHCGRQRDFLWLWAAVTTPTDRMLHYLNAAPAAVGDWIVRVTDPRYRSP